MCQWFEFEVEGRVGYTFVFTVIVYSCLEDFLSLETQAKQLFQVPI